MKSSFSIIWDYAFPFRLEIWYKAKLIYAWLNTSENASNTNVNALE